MVSLRSECETRQPACLHTARLRWWPEGTSVSPPLTKGLRGSGGKISPTPVESLDRDHGEPDRAWLQSHK